VTPYCARAVPHAEESDSSQSDSWEALDRRYEAGSSDVIALPKRIVVSSGGWEPARRGAPADVRSDFPSLNLTLRDQATGHIHDRTRSAREQV
jgi:hypothetical protein